MAKQQQFCPKCKRTLDDSNFYTYKDGAKVEHCKKCQTMHIDNYDPNTFLWLLEQMDVPYIEEEWNTLRDRAQERNGPYKPLTGMSVFGKYLSKMKLKQWSQYSWEDTERLAAVKDQKYREAQAAGIIPDQNHLQEMFDSGEISEAEFKTLSEEQPVAPPPGTQMPVNHPGYLDVGVNIANDLTEEDQVYLAMKWGRFYTPEQWVRMEQLHKDFHNSFDIQGAAREDTLKKICATSIKMNDAIETGDTDTFQKLSRVYDSLMKSGKFTEAQNKEDGKGFVNSIGELVALCESESGFIPRYVTDVPQDIVDKTMQDMNQYVENLITKDLGLAQQIEDHLKKMEIQKEMEEDEEELFEASAGMDSIERTVLQDADFAEYFDEIETQRLADLALEEEEEEGDE